MCFSRFYSRGKQKKNRFGIFFFNWLQTLPPTNLALGSTVAEEQKRWLEGGSLDKWYSEIRRGDQEWQLGNSRQW